MKNTIKSINPANEIDIQEFPDWGMEIIHPIIEAVDKAFEKWQLLEFTQRAQCFFKMAQILRDRKTEYAILMANEMGKPVSQGEAEIEKCAWVCEHYAERTTQYLTDRNIETENSESFVTFKPLGVIYMIMPWNFPFWQVIRGAAPTVMAGNTIVLKHASNVFGCAIAIEQLFKAAGFPDNVFRSLLTGSHTSADIIAHPKIRAVTLTGSERAGQQVAAHAGQNLKKSVLELGGSDPYIILEDADIDLAVASCGASRMLNGGQVCIAAKRFIVVESRRKEFEAKVLDLMRTYQMGDPLDPASNFGPMSKVKLRDELHQQVLQSVEQGARLALGGEIPAGSGAWYPATVLTNVKRGMTAYSEELFGPVATIISAKDEVEAIDIANESDFGLGGAIFTRDIEKGRRLARDMITTGTCVVNGFVKSDPRLPFGGIKKSGYGREIGEFGILEFVNIKTVVVS
ncbi:MAG: NAD-dependent succinate-semialdehyde dehydrogenase [gamma proteobacterium symbiont of Bathyaustriella thionipta]|nr:NAD-dependent succinate-semialdehyde dehydrogenase [gamma proteobacterium symbiont of Bathyaustriella thionipta]MCU7948735.1 NAD-dependent succinate-semialdehyde dehydrogenase [gamma proteobacterium symbiont of Bathyaustriella thionipta]MCU7954638.1 NAD-dependent succinate-semialdehyde dehydrogenase [gamma proteobacterium symbiont of Bathyaustriella thionipta]MCU7955218.1 NAD-dependent succinate-semialdehyde dehydrogenase [gamma proteobacterium symbiont of Bathyaustriella thionipta]MCU796823